MVESSYTDVILRKIQDEIEAPLRAQLAEAKARIAELDRLLAYGTDTDAYRRIRARAERAEAERDALRRDMEWIETKAKLARGAGEFEAHSILGGIAHTARAALAPSPAGEKS